MNHVSQKAQAKKHDLFRMVRALQKIAGADVFAISNLQVLLRASLPMEVNTPALTIPKYIVFRHFGQLKFLWQSGRLADSRTVQGNAPGRWMVHV